MVKKANLFLAAVIVILTASACTVDLFGLFGSSDMSARWKARDTFNFVQARDSLNLGDSYSFIVVSDTHIESDADVQKLSGLKNVIAADPSIMFVVVTGDITQNGARDDVKRFIDVAHTFGVPCYPVAGNHDVYFGNYSVWKELIGSTCYKIAADTATLLIMDSANGHFGKEQLEWLENELKASVGKRTFIFTHSNLFVKSIFDWMQFSDSRERAKIVSMLKGRCDGMFMGHLHKRVVTIAGGVEYLSIEDMKVSRAYCLVKVTPQGVTWEIKKL